MDLIAETLALRDKLDTLPLPEGVRFTYNPLRYAWGPHRRYLEQFCWWRSTVDVRDEEDGIQRRRIALVGMNPGPWGMVQTGVPFGDVPNAIEILGGTRIAGDGSPLWIGDPKTSSYPLHVERPSNWHPERPVLGFACERVEESGKRLWGTLRSLWAMATGADTVGLDVVLRDVFAVNWCPLAFFGDAPPPKKGHRGVPENLTPSDLDAPDLAQLRQVCAPYLQRVIQVMRPEVVVCVGRFAEREVASLLPPRNSGSPGPTLVYLTHPSPRNGDAAAWARECARVLGPWLPGSKS